MKSQKIGNVRNISLPMRFLRILGIQFFGKKIWVSELTSIVFVCVLLVSLLYVSFLLLQNETVIHDFDRNIAEMKAQKISAVHEMEVMREKLRVVMLMREVVGDQIKPETIERLADLIYKSSLQFGYNPELLLAVIAVESKFNPVAMGRYRSGGLSGALGLMQIKYETAISVAKTLGIDGLKRQDLLDPEINMILGTAYLTMLISNFKSFQMGIMAYNLGPVVVRSSISRGEKLPMRYYEKILAQYYKLKALGDELEM